MIAGLNQIIYYKVEWLDIYIYIYIYIYIMPNITITDEVYYETGT